MPTSITAQTSGATPIPTVVGHIFENGVKLKGKVTGNGSGVLAFTTLAQGTYELTLEKAGYVFPNYQITVDGSGAPTPAVVTGAALSITAPAKPPTCCVYGYLFDSAGEPTGYKVIVEVLGKNEMAAINTGETGTGENPAKAIVVGERREAISSRSSGYVAFHVPIGSRVRVSIHEIDYHRTFEVPNQSALNLRDVIELQGAKEGGEASFGLSEESAFDGDIVGG